jgi:multiple sugar transport system substrate-binding protein
MKKLVLFGMALVVLTLGLSACATPTPQVVEKVVEKEVPVKETVVVEKEKVVEKIVEVTPVPVDYGSILFLSTQARPVEEAEKMRGVILAGFPGKVDFIPEDEGPFADRVAAEAKAGKGSVDVLGALHGNFTTMTDTLEDLTPLMAKLADRGIPSAFVELGKLGTDKQLYIPWMQATYIVAANKKALDYLPAGADPEALTWEQYRDWAKNIFKATGEKKVGFPAGEKGLMHRFLQGYIYPSYTGGMVSGFRSPEAVTMWEFVNDMWQYVHPQSVAYEFMQEPLLAEEVWVTFDHTARLINAFKDRPNDFLALPAPSGPKGLGFMPVVAGLAIPKTAPNKAGVQLS